MNNKQGFITILTGLYSFQDCVHFIASIRKFHVEPIVVLIDRVPPILYPILTVFKNVTLKPAPSSENPVLSSRLAKISLYDESPFEKTIFMDCDICLLSGIGEVFDALDQNTNFLITEDVQPAIPKASNLLRKNSENILQTLKEVGLPLQETSIQYNTGFIAFNKKPENQLLFQAFHKYFDVVLSKQDTLLLRDQGAFAAAVETVQPHLQVLSPAYNYLDKWKEIYALDEPIKVMHCTYPYRPQYAKNVTRSLYSRIFDRIAKFVLPNQVNNPWRSR